jgi:O-antigen ligase
MTLNSKNTAYKVYRILLPALAFSIPIYEKAAALVIVLIGLNWIAEFNFREKLKQLSASSGSRLILSFAFLYIIYLVGASYSENLYGNEGAWFDLEIKLSLLIFPLMVSTIHEEFFDSRTLGWIFNVFICGCLLSALLLLSVSAFRFFQDGNSEVFFYSGLSWIHHPGYLSLYFSFAAVLLIRKIITDSHIRQTIRVIMMVAVILLEIMIVLLSSKAGIIGFGLALAVVLVFYAGQNQHKGSGKITYILVFGGIFIILNLLSPPTYRRFFDAGKAIATNAHPDKNAEASSEIRILIWKAAFEIIKEHPVLGVGTGDVKPALIKKYRKHGYQHAIDSNLNAHSQYLQTYIAAGILGFLALCAGLIIPLWISVKKRNLGLMVFIVLFGFHILVESMLERQAGVVFYAFFNSLLFANLVQQRNRSHLQLPEV